MELLNTIISRPYVFAFLAVYLFLSIKLWGLRKSLLWLVSGYVIAWASEVSSIHNGFPYGEYHYIYENLKGELLVSGVPFFDSLSYPFLIFAGYTMAKFILSGHETRDTRHETKTNIFGSQVSSLGSRVAGPVLLGALFTMLLDVIIDPIATMGDKWFLGKIHFYAHPGIYFGVPLTNFAGWFLVALAVIVFNVILFGLETRDLRPETKIRGIKSRVLILYPLFYISIALFNIAITFWVGEWKLGIASSIILTLIFLLPTWAFIKNR